MTVNYEAKNHEPSKIVEMELVDGVYSAKRCSFLESLKKSLNK